MLNKIKLINEKKNQPKPILLKISPDLNKNQLLDIIEIVKKIKIDGVIATNTTLSREGLKSKNKSEEGGGACQGGWQGQGEASGQGKA